MKEARQNGVHAVFIQNSRKWKLVYSDRKQSVVAWEWEGGAEGRMDYKESVRKLLREMNIFIILIMEIISVIYICPISSHSSRLNMYMLLYDSYTLIKLYSGSIKKQNKFTEDSFWFWSQSYIQNYHCQFFLFLLELVYFELVIISWTSENQRIV